MVARDEEYGGTGAYATEVVTLGDVLWQGILVLGIFVGHEGVTQIDMEVGLVGQGIGKSFFVQRGAGALVEVGIRLQGEGEGGTWFALGVESARGRGLELAFPGLSGL